jgi:hypothetical protein
VSGGLTAEFDALFELSVLIFGRLAPQKHPLIAEMSPSDVLAAIDVGAFGGLNPMSKQDEYLDSAAHAVELAARISSSDEKSHLLELAERRRDLADRCRHQATPPLKEHRLVRRAFRGLP